MKLVYAVVNSDDTRNVANAVTKAGFSATKLSSTGGFLSSGNTTFLICTEDERVYKFHRPLISSCVVTSWVERVIFRFVVFNIRNLFHNGIYLLFSPR